MIEGKVLLQLDKFHLITEHPKKGRCFVCNKSRSFVYCEQGFNFCPLCGDPVEGKRV